MFWDGFLPLSALNSPLQSFDEAVLSQARGSPLVSLLSLTLTHDHQCSDSCQVRRHQIGNIFVDH